MFKSVMTAAKLTLVFLNIWVLAVVLVVSLGHWRVFESNDPTTGYDNSHLIVMRELKEDENKRFGFIGSNVSQNLHHVERKPEENPSASFSIRPSIIPAVPSSLVSNVYDTRVANLRHWCTQQHPYKMPYEKIDKIKLNSILVDQRHKLLYCQIPGIAINEWRKIMLILSGVVNATSTYAISGGDVYGKYAKFSKRLSDFGDKERGMMLKTYYKVVFVRDPLERLVIAYRTKLLNKASKYFHKAFGSPIIKKYRKNAKPTEIKDGTNVRFSEFVKFIIDNEHEGKEALNEHWEQYYKQCHPCLVDYNFVGLFENVEQDIKHVLDKLKATNLIKPPFVGDRKVLPQSELSKIYGEITGSELNNLFKVYSADYTLFGYQCPNFVHDLLQKEKIVHDY